MRMIEVTPRRHEPWNKGMLGGQKAPLRLRDIWAIRVRLQLKHKVRDLALFDLAIDSKLRACDLVKLRVCDIAHGGHVSARATVLQQNPPAGAVRNHGTGPGSDRRLGIEVGDDLEIAEQTGV